ncbi:MAG: hypothetical protein R3F11_27365 [Verrucomicrobiales bacterium]
MRPSDPQADLAGKRVTVTLIGSSAHLISGMVRNYAAASKHGAAITRTRPAGGGATDQTSETARRRPPATFIILDTRGGTKYLSASQIAQITVDKRSRPRCA